MIEVDLQARFDAAQKYLATRANPPWGDNWTAGYKSYLAENLTLPQAIALCHPRDWSHLVEDDLSIILDQDSFQRDPHPGECESASIFGYPCPLDEEVLHQDHVFPRSLGGMTHGSNRRILCAYHNYAKGVDIHIYPWTDSEPEWVGIVLSRISNLQK